MKKYWFTLYPDTFLWIKENVGFIYNIVSDFIVSANLAEDKVPGPGTGYFLYQHPSGIPFSYF